MNLFKSNNLLKQFIRNSYLKTWFRCNTNSTSDPKDLNPMERQFDDLSVDSFQSLISDNVMKERIKLILSEYEYQKYTTLRVPTTITTDQMVDLLRVDGPEDRDKMFRFLYTKEIERLRSNRKKREISDRYWKEKNEFYSKINAERTGIWDHNNQLIYGLWHNTLFSKIMKQSVSRLRSHSLRRAAIFGQKLVIDLDFDKYMKLYENRLLLKQLALLYSYNKHQTIEPFDLYFTNCDPNTTSMQEMNRFFNNYKSPQFLATFHSQSYLDLFPNKQLVYLSPHSRQTLHTFNDDDIYIIGGLIDKSNHEPHSYLKAQKEGIRTVRLPLDEHVLWRTGTKSLCLNHIIAILHDIKWTADWSQTLRQNIPQRKQKTDEEIEFEDSLRKQKLNRMNRKQKYINFSRV